MYSFDCDFIGAGSLNAPSHHFGFNCADSTETKALMALGLMATIVLLALALLGALCHDNTPSSYSVLARANTCIDTTYACAGILLQVLFTALRGHYRGMQAAAYVSAKSVSKNSASLVARCTH